VLDAASRYQTAPANEEMSAEVAELEMVSLFA
jgi:hypothetical protein